MTDQAKTYFDSIYLSLSGVATEIELTVPKLPASDHAKKASEQLAAIFFGVRELIDNLPKPPINGKALVRAALPANAFFERSNGILTYLEKFANSRPQSSDTQPKQAVQRVVSGCRHAAADALMALDYAYTITPDDDNLAVNENPAASDIAIALEVDEVSFEEVQASADDSVFGQFQTSADDLGFGQFQASAPKSGFSQFRASAPKSSFKQLQADVNSLNTGVPVDQIVYQKLEHAKKSLKALKKASFQPTQEQIGDYTRAWFNVTARLDATAGKKGNQRQHVASLVYIRDGINAVTNRLGGLAEVSVGTDIPEY